MPPQGRPPQRPQQIPQCLVAKEVHALIGHFKPRIRLCISLLAVTWSLRLFSIQEFFILHALNDLVDQLFHLVRRQTLELLLRILVQHFARLQRLLDSFPQIIHRLLAIKILKRRHRVLEPGVQQKIGKRLHQVVEPKARRKVTGKLCISCQLHKTYIQFRRSQPARDSNLPSATPLQPQWNDPRAGRLHSCEQNQVPSTRRQSASPPVRTSASPIKLHSSSAMATRPQA